MPKKIVIIGGGIGGVASANLLAKAGYDVTILEQHGQLGGRAGSLQKEGFRFDTGPSWYLMPGVFDHYFELLGETTKDLDLQRLSPAYKIFFEQNPPITVTSDLEADAATFESIERGAGRSLHRYVANSQKLYDLSIQHFLYTNFERIRDLLSPRLLIPFLPMAKLLVTPIDRYVSRFVRDQRLKQILEYPMVFLGTSPYTAPAMYSLMSAMDFREGVFYPKRGMYSIIEKMQATAEYLGVQVRTNAVVEQILVEDRVATGVLLNDGSNIQADIVISNADLHFTETQLLDAAWQSFPESYWQPREAGPTALLLYLGVDAPLPELEHHNLLFVDAWRENFTAIYDTKKAPEKASIYISKTSKTDEGSAPAGKENIFVLIPLPTEPAVTREYYDALTVHYMQQIKQMTGVDLTERVITKEVFYPDMFEQKFNSWQSSMLGQSHLLRQSALFRTPNRSRKVKNLFYVGGSTVPGIGLPMCLISAELVYKRIIGNKKAGPVERL